MNKEITIEDVEDYFNDDYTNLKDKFEFEFEKIKKQLHKDMTKLFKRFPNAKDFKVNFNYNWIVNCSSDITTDFDGWYDNIVNRLIKKWEKEQND